MQDRNPRSSQRPRLNPISIPLSTTSIISAPMAQRGQFIRFTGAKRPVDKQLVVVNKSAVDATQVNTTLVTVTFPCTIVGLRWDMSVIQQGGTGNSIFAWCINVLRDGGTQKVMSTSDGTTFFAPESDCLAFGFGGIDNNVDGRHYNGSTKTMRKMMGGDKLIFSVKGIATNTTTVLGVIQFFCKT